MTPAPAPDTTVPVRKNVHEHTRTPENPYAEGQPAGVQTRRLAVAPIPTWTAHFRNSSLYR